MGKEERGAGGRVRLPRPIDTLVHLKQQRQQEWVEVINELSQRYLGQIEYKVACQVEYKVACQT